VRLIDMNKHGCIDSITHCIVIDPLFTFYIPNAFTPNGDGVNDVFAPKGGYFKTFDMYIFDRWGTTIYHTLDINKGWNGSYNNNNNMCQMDTYVYVIKVTDWKNVDHTYMGRVSLVK
jgi:gliding motility-associated-like protein